MKLPYQIDIELSNKIIASMKEAIDRGQALIFAQAMTIWKQQRRIEELERERREAVGGGDG